MSPVTAKRLNVLGLLITLATVLIAVLWEL